MPAQAPARNRALVLLIAAGILVRIALGLASGPPGRFADTLGYELLASRIATGDLTGHDGFRTPIYPLFMLLCAGNGVAIVALQMALGVGISVVLYAAFRILTGSTGLGLAAGLAYSLNFSQLLYETNLLTETTTTFLVSVSLLLALRIMKSGPPPRLGQLFLVGLVSSLAVLDRPQCVLVPALVFIFVTPALWRRAPDRRRITAGLAGFLLPVCILLGGWSGLNRRATGYFALSTLTGLNLTHWSGQYIEAAPEKYARIGSIYARYRDERGTSRQTIWSALGEIEGATGLSAAQVSDVLGKMSLSIIREKPKAYLTNVFFSWVDFWKPSFLHAKPPPGFIVRPLRWGIVGLEIVFLLGPIAWVLSRRVRSRIGPTRGWALVYCLVLGTSIEQAFLISVENDRYSVVVDPWTIGTAICVLSLAGGPQWRGGRGGPRRPGVGNVSGSGAAEARPAPGPSTTRAADPQRPAS